MSEGDVYFDTDLNYRFAIENEFFFKTLLEHRIKSFFMVYDILPLTMPSFFPTGIPQLHKQWLEIACRNGFLICISETVLSEVRAWAEESRLILEACSVRLGFDLDIKASMNNPKKRVENTRESLDFLVVSTIEPRKAHNQVLKAFDILWAKGLDCRLIFVGRKGWKVDHLISQIEQHELLDKKLLWLKDIEDLELADLFQSSTALINASKGEGFGLPLVEAASYGLPLILRDIPIFREIAGNQPWYFSGASPAELAISVEQWISEYQSGRIDSNIDFRPVTWSQTCDQIISVIDVRKEER
jgi:glycosyltransferase involved in cell wall biosynthesis